MKKHLISLKSIASCVTTLALAFAMTLSLASVLTLGLSPSVAEAQSSYYPYGPCYNFTSDLQIGSTGQAVEALHNILSREGFNRSNSWSISNQTYNEETASLVSGFQERYASEILTPAGLRYGTGFVGSYTRTKLNALCGTTGGGTNNGYSPTISNLSAPSTLRTGETGTWSLNATDPQNRQLTYYVSWGDEAYLPYPVSGATVPSTSLYDQRSTFTHAYSNPGTYTVTFRVRNTAGYESQTTSTVYVTNNGGSTNTDGISVSVSTNKYSYAQGEAITFYINARNNTAYEKILNFNSGCQTSYSIGPYNSANNQACTLALTSVRIPAYGTQTWTVTHYPSTYNLPSGTYTLTGRVIGYGEATATVTVGSGSGWPDTSNTPRVLSPNGNQWLQRGSYSTISWSMPAAYYYASQAVDVYMLLQSSSQYPYTTGGQAGYSTCPIGSTCAYNPNASYPYYPTYGGTPNYGTKYAVLQNTTIREYNWVVGSTPTGWSSMVPGTYLMQVCLTGTNNCDVSDSTFTIY